MKANLLFESQDFDPHQDLPPSADALTQDLELNTLFEAMAAGDSFLFDVAKAAILAGVRSNVDTIAYRQNILKDCLKNPNIIREIYNIAVEAIEGEKKIYWGIFSRYPSAILSRGVEVLGMFVNLLKRLRKVADDNAGSFSSQGFRTFFEMVQKELSDDYFAEIQNHLQRLKFRGGVLVSAELGEGNKGIHYTLREAPHKKTNFIERLFAPKENAYTIVIDPRDENGAKALSELNDRGINPVANAMAQSVDHILNFFILVRTELAFYLGCMNLHESLDGEGEPTTYPVAAASSERKLTFRKLYDVSLALTMGQKIVSNDLDADEKDLGIITGANQGGKSTFLRSIGIAQLMMQAGMFVPAESFCANTCDGLFTHYKREEDTRMESGKFDEELSRMNEIIEQIRPHSLVLFNESFAATNEREGSEIARQIVSALLENHIKVFYVSHQYEFAHGFYEKKMENAIFLRADRQEDGQRTFKIVAGEPLQTSFGEDLYNKVFAEMNAPSILEGDYSASRK